MNKIKGFFWIYIRNLNIIEKDNSKHSLIFLMTLKIKT